VEGARRRSRSKVSLMWAVCRLPSGGRQGKGYTVTSVNVPSPSDFRSLFGVGVSGCGRGEDCSRPRTDACMWRHRVRPLP
jgi:hypothetical protein